MEGPKYELIVAAVGGDEEAIRCTGNRRLLPD